MTCRVVTGPHGVTFLCSRGKTDTGGCKLCGSPVRASVDALCEAHAREVRENPTFAAWVERQIGAIRAS